MDDTIDTLADPAAEARRVLAEPLPQPLADMLGLPASRGHVVLLGDSILDNGAYTDGGADVVTQMRTKLQPGWQCTLLAVDGSLAADVPAQLGRLPADATHLVLSVGGNDALHHEHILDTPVQASGEAFLMLAAAVDAFEPAYRSTVADCLRPGLPLTVCTIYHGNFPTPAYQRVVRVALTAYNDVILRVAAENDVRNIDLRGICTAPEDYANVIEPSATGGAKIATAIAHAVLDAAASGAAAAS